MKCTCDPCYEMRGREIHSKGKKGEKKKKKREKERKREKKIADGFEPGIFFLKPP